MIHLISEIIPAGKEGIVLEKGLLSDRVGRRSHRTLPQISSRYGRIFGNNWTRPAGHTLVMMSNTAGYQYVIIEVIIMSSGLGIEFRDFRKIPGVMPYRLKFRAKPFLGSGLGIRAFAYVPSPDVFLFGIRIREASSDMPG